jgi:hypothetical protein
VPYVLFCAGMFCNFWVCSPSSSSPSFPMRFFPSYH